MVNSKKMTVIVGMLGVVAGCGLPPQKVTRTMVVKEIAAESCKVEQLADGALISCPDGSSAFVPNGTDGQHGQDGQDGQDGESCTVTEINTGAVVECGNNVTVVRHGQDGTDGADGQDGANGQDGADGKDGKNGKNLTDMLYMGHFCGRAVLKIGNKYYSQSSSLLPITSNWRKISNTCKLRLYKNKLQEGDV